MKAPLIKWLFLLALTALFAWSQHYYAKVEKETHDEIIVMQYKVLDKQVWSMEEAAKNHALSQDSSYDALQVLQERNKDAGRKHKIGFWLALIFAIASSGYGLYVLYLLVAVKLIREAGYKKIMKMIERSSEFPEERGNPKL